MTTHITVGEGRRDYTLAAKAAAIGSRATTLQGMARAIRATLTAKSFPPHGPSARVRTGDRATLRRERIIRKAADPAYTLPPQAEPSSLAILAEERERLYQSELARCAASVTARLRDLYQLPAIESSLARSWPMRRSTSSWAGGEHRVHVSIAAEVGASGGSERAWSNNGKWRGTNSYADLRVSLRALAYFPTLRTPDGLIVLDAERLGPREYRLTWVEQGRGFALRAVRGYLIRGYHSAKPTLEAARREAAQARTKTLAALRQRRHRNKDLGSVFVSLEDSLRAGNCLPASEQFARQIWDHIGAVGPCAVRADVVLAIRNDRYVTRAVSAAIARG